MSWGLLYRGPEWRLALAGSEGRSPRGAWTPTRPAGDHRGASITCPRRLCSRPPGDDIFTGQRPAAVLPFLPCPGPCPRRLPWTRGATRLRRPDTASRGPLGHTAWAGQRRGRAPGRRQWPRAGRGEKLSLVLLQLFAPSPRWPRPGVLRSLPNQVGTAPGS